ncbi:hypothetical protein [Deinococcus soli (ex Cha et al. 2016)]|uniref:Uncharacterized protein n=1 Tax=Deinococcus soli (ex Cha et al. 2016) TaxID=1309411 RepID=A0ACC6KLY1_9DEIO|nr:hypothetical protein [Deinococcus soli (ex Cha et al. 2016)]MDR6753464.1 hypothetical protein [Deinococcus soli (ex Cha et al. 2016)]
MQAESLAPLLEEMFEQSRASGNPVTRQLLKGLSVKARERGGKRMLIVWRAGKGIPGATECEIVGQDSGLIAPKFQTWQCRESDQAFLITEGWQGELCTHAWGPTDPLVEGKATGERCVCTRCGADWTRLTGPRGKVTLTYNGSSVKREAVWNRWLVTGPAPAPHVEEVEEIPPEVLEELASQPVQTAQRPHWRDRQKADKPVVDHVAVARQQELDAQERQRLSGPLLVVSLWCATWDPWFRRAVAIGIRRDYLKSAPLPELRAEVRGGYHQRTYPHAWRVVLLLCRWKHVTRALPEHATPAPKPKRKSAPRNASRKRKTA